MNRLLAKFNEYKSIVNYRVQYEFEDGTIIEFKPKQTDFPHLIGLHKLVDIPVIRQFNDKNNKTVSAKFLISKIKKEEMLTDEVIRKSNYFPDIEERYENFTKENILSLSYTDVIVDFEPSLIGSALNARYILYEKKGAGGYNHLCIAENAAGGNYLESFFYNATNLYLKNQKKIKINYVKIFDNKGNLYLEDKMDFGPYEFIVKRIDGDYAALVRADLDFAEERLVARALLPAEIYEGCHLRYECLCYEMM